MHITVIVPMFNEEKNILPLSQRLHASLGGYGQPYEIIFVDDGSSDNSVRVAEDLCSKGDNVKLIPLGIHSGKDAALYAGFKEAEGDAIVTIDGDLQNFPEDIPLLLDTLGAADAVIGWRKKRHDPFLKVVSSRIANSVRNMIFHDGFHDLGCGLRVFRKECLNGIGPCKLYDLFIMVILKYRGYKVVEVVVRHAARAFGNSKFNIRNRIVWQTLAMFQVWRLTRNEYCLVKYHPADYS